MILSSQIKSCTSFFSHNAQLFTVSSFKPQELSFLLCPHCFAIYSTASKRRILSDFLPVCIAVYSIVPLNMKTAESYGNYCITIHYIALSESTTPNLSAQEISQNSLRKNQCAPVLIILAHIDQNVLRLNNF